jgi:DNA-binding NtrC family response regulator
VILCRDGRICPSHLPAELSASGGNLCESPPGTFREAKIKAVEQFERAYLTDMLIQCGGIVRRAAQRAHLSERNFHQKLRKYGIEGKAFRN